MLTLKITFILTHTHTHTAALSYLVMYTGIRLHVRPPEAPALPKKHTHTQTHTWGQCTKHPTWFYSDDHARLQLGAARDVTRVVDIHPQVVAHVVRTQISRLLLNTPIHIGLLLSAQHTDLSSSAQHIDTHRPIAFCSTHRSLAFCSTNRYT